MSKLEFTPLEFETVVCREVNSMHDIALEFTPLEFETINNVVHSNDINSIRIYSVGV